MFQFPALPRLTYGFSRRVPGLDPGGFPHSEHPPIITPAARLPEAYRSVPRPSSALAPRHPPHALSSLSQRTRREIEVARVLIQAVSVPGGQPVPSVLTAPANGSGPAVATSLSAYPNRLTVNLHRTKRPGAYPPGRQRPPERMPDFANATQTFRERPRTQTPTTGFILNYSIPRTALPVKSPAVRR